MGKGKSLWGRGMGTLPAWGRTSNRMGIFEGEPLSVTNPKKREERYRPWGVLINDLER